MAQNKPRPKRSYKAMIDALRHVWKISHVADTDAIWKYARSRETHLEHQPLRLTIWNICKGVGSTLFEHDFRLIAFRSDLLLIQEALLSQHSLATFCESGYGVVHAASYRRSDGLRDGVMTLAKAHGSRLQRVVSKNAEPFLKTPKVSLVTFYELKDSHQKLMVVNVHSTLIRTKAGAVKEVKHLLENLPDHEGPAIIAGDFNTFTRQYLDAVIATMADSGFVYSKIDNEPRAFQDQLDQVFVRGLEVKSCHVDTSVSSSDHFPLHLHLILK